MDKIKININQDQAIAFGSMLKSIDAKFESKELENGEIEFEIEPSPMLEAALKAQADAQKQEVPKSDPGPGGIAPSDGSGVQSSDAAPKPAVAPGNPGNSQTQARG